MKRWLPYLLILAVHGVVFHHAWSNRQEVTREEWLVATHLQKPTRDSSVAWAHIESERAGRMSQPRVVIPKELVVRLPKTSEQRAEFLVRFGRHNEPWIVDVRLTDKIAP